MTCYTLSNCTSWPHCGSLCDGKGCSYLQMSSDTRHKVIAQTSSKITSYPLKISAPTDENHKYMKHMRISLSLSQILEFLTLNKQSNWARIEEDPAAMRFFCKTTFDHKRFSFMADRPDICHFFSTNVLLRSIFLHMKARKLWQKIRGKTAWITD